MKNPKAFTYSLIALVCLALTFLIHWGFIIGAVFFSGLGWKELSQK